MGYFTALQDSVYPNLPLPALPAGPGFSVVAAKSLCWAAQLAYEADDRSKLDRILAAWKWTLVTPLSVVFAAPFRIPTLGGYIAKADDGSSIVAFAGTEPEYLQNWLRDFKFAPNDNGIHSGFADGVDSVIQHLLTSVGDNAIWFTGHSLGAALAALSAHRLCIMGSPNATRIKGVYSCGMPRLGTDQFAAHYVGLPIAGGSLGEQTFRLVYGDDVVPHVPPSQAPFGFRHVGRELTTPHAGQFNPASLDMETMEPAGAVDLTLITRAVSSLLPGWAPNLPPYPARNPGVTVVVETLPRGVRDHLMDRYLGAL